MILHDLGYMHERPDILEKLLALMEKDGVIIVDDFQKPEYQAEVNRRLGKYDSLESHSLRWLTLDKFLRYCLLVQRRPNSPAA